MGSSQGPSSLVLKAVLLCLLFFTHTSSDPHPTAKASLPCAHLVLLHSQLQHTQEVLGERYQGWGGVPLLVPTRAVFHFLFSNLLSSFIIRYLNSCFARINLFSPLSMSGIKGEAIKSASALLLLRQSIQTKQCVSWDTWHLTRVWSNLKLMTVLGQAARPGSGTFQVGQTQWKGSFCKAGQPQAVRGLCAGVASQPSSIRRNLQVSFPTSLDQDFYRACGASSTGLHTSQQRTNSAGKKHFWIDFSWGKGLSHARPKPALRCRCLDHSFGYRNKDNPLLSSSWAFL